MNVTDANSPAISNVQVGQANGSVQGKSLDYDAFITLLITQLKHQDPTKPMDPSEFVSQLATISSVGQAVKTNSMLASLLTVNSLIQAEQLIGKTIASADGSASGIVTSVSVSSAGSTATLANGSVVFLTDGVKVSKA